MTEGTKVTWEWGNGRASGEIKEVFTSRVEKIIDGNDVVREASADEPAYLIIQDDGQEVLKSSSEVEKADD